MIWLIERTVSNCLWVLPFLSMFWISKEKTKRRASFQLLAEDRQFEVLETTLNLNEENSSDDDDWTYDVSGVTSTSGHLIFSSA